MILYIRILRVQEVLLAACIWYPWNYKDGNIFCELAQVKSIYDLSNNNQDDCCAQEILDCLSMKEILKNPILPMNIIIVLIVFNKVRGSITIPYQGTHKLFRRQHGEKIFHCKPSDESPYTWVDENSIEVLRFERIASPIREATQEAYFRQPVLFRWVCNAEWLKQKLEELQLRIFFFTSHETMPFVDLKNTLLKRCGTGVPINHTMPRFFLNRTLNGL